MENNLIKLVMLLGAYKHSSRWALPQLDMKHDMALHGPVV